MENYARQWAKSKKEELDFLSELVKHKSHFKIPHQACMIKNIYIYPSSFNKPEVIKEIDRLHEEYVLVTADKVCSKIVFVSKVHYYQ
jgi:hypothetical protein